MDQNNNKRGGGRWAGQQGRGGARGPQQSNPRPTTASPGQQGRGGGRGPQQSSPRPTTASPGQQGRGGGRGQRWGPQQSSPRPSQQSGLVRPQQSGPSGPQNPFRPNPWSGGPPRGPGPQQNISNPYRGEYGGSSRGFAGPGPSRSPAPGRGSRTGQPMPDMQMLKITENIRPPSGPKAAEINLYPVKRPDKGGVLSIRAPNLLANFFPVKFNSNSIMIHYDIDIKLETPPKGRPSKVMKSDLSLIKEKLFLDNPDFQLSHTTFDGEKNIYSAIQLPTGIFKVDFSIAEDRSTRPYLVTVKEVNRLKYSKVKDYLEGNVLLIPRDVLQGMDLVMKENPSRCRISVGRGFYPVENKREDDLKWGITASKGFQSSLKSTSQGLAMCLDYTVLAFRKRLPVIDYLLEYMGWTDARQLREMYYKDIIKALENLKVNITHRVTKQKFTIAGLTDKVTRYADFPMDEPEGGQKRVKVVDYYRDTYGLEIVQLDIPCLDLGKNGRKNYVPMEFCVLVQGQRFPKEQLGKDGERTLKNMSVVRPDVRKATICEMVRGSDGPSGGVVSQNFGLQVVKDMTQVQGRVIGPPQLKIGAGVVINVDREKCQWNLVKKSVVEGKSLERWVIIDFSSREQNWRFKLDQGKFIGNLMSRCRELGILMTDPLQCLSMDMNLFMNVDELEKRIRSLVEHPKGRVQMILCVMSRLDAGYKILKWLSETRIGVMTQVCLSEPANDGRDQYLANLGIKINAKLGGSNMELTHEFPTFPGEGHAMFIGADVNHPGSQRSSSTSREDGPPSIAAVVGTVNWPAANRYAARIAPQYGRTEKIMKFGAMCKELIEAYARVNKVKPQRIVVFRDGVSESQFHMVLNEELFDLKEAIYDEDYRPTITVLVAQKRHQTRLFPRGREDGCETGNVPPGTVVDTVITHPFEFDFYLCSHYGSLGTSKPTHYYVLYDDHNFTSDLLQKLIYDLCFTFARCTKPVSLVPPVYYADLVAYRGRMYQEAMGLIPPKSACFRSASPSTFSLDDQLYKLHPELVDKMFFV